jgi:aldehyde dehydrogenase (NAD+)
MITARADEPAAPIVTNAGLPLSMAHRDVDDADRYFHSCVGLADKLRGETITLIPILVDFTVQGPLGVCAVGTHEDRQLKKICVAVG